MLTNLKPRPTGIPPSPLLFIAAVPLAAAILVALSLIAGEEAPVARLDDGIDVDRLAMFNDNRHFRVAAIGSSLMHCALLPDEIMGAHLTKQYGETLFLSFTQSGRNLDNVEPFLRRLRKTPPDLLIIEGEMLAWGQIRDGFAQRFREWRGRIRRFVEKVIASCIVSWTECKVLVPLLVSPEGRVEEGQTGGQTTEEAEAEAVRNKLAVDGIDDRGTSFDPGDYLGEVSQWRLREMAELKEIIASLSALRERGCRVVILSLGRSPTAQAILPTNLKSDYAGFLDRMTTHGFVVEREYGRIPQELYRDAAHLNERGRKVFSGHFLERMEYWKAVRP